MELTSSAQEDSAADSENSERLTQVQSREGMFTETSQPHVVCSFQGAKMPFVFSTANSAHNAAWEEPTLLSHRLNLS